MQKVKRVDVFTIIAYFLLGVFSLFCLYPFLYAISASLSGATAMNEGRVILWPVDVQFDAFKAIFTSFAPGRGFWISYANTLFVTFYGTIWAMFVAITGAYALSKKRLKFRKAFNFFIVFTIWFTAGMIPMWINYVNTRNVFEWIGISDHKWVVVIAMGMAAFNIILLRNAFEAVPKEIEEAALVDGATEFQLLTRVYLPMSKSTLATVGLFFAISRWNGYFWANKIIAPDNYGTPLQVYIRNELSKYTDIAGKGFAQESLIYAAIVCAIIPIIIVYPYIQRYFAKGVNMGGVKE